MDAPLPLPYLQELCAELVTMVTPVGESLTVQQKGGHPGRPVAIYALAQGAVDMVSTGLGTWSTLHVAAMPMFRFGWEAAITAQWLVNTETGAEALINEQTRLRRAARTDALISPMFSESISGSSADLDTLDTAVQDAGRNFRARCFSFVDGAGLYVMYRLMSGYCHAGAAFVEDWIEQGENDHFAIRDTSRLEQEQSTSWPATGVIAAMWAARSLDYFTPGRPHRSRLRQIARELGAAEHLTFRPEAAQSGSSYLAGLECGCRPA